MNWTDCGLILRNPEGSLAKRPRRSGMHGSDPLDHDPAAKDIMFRDLICAAGNGSDGQDGSGALGRRRATAGDSVRGGAALGSPEKQIRRFRGWFGLRLGRAA